jgi:S-adenosylmethionine decarboxylase
LIKPNQLPILKTTDNNPNSLNQSSQTDNTARVKPILKTDSQQSTKTNSDLSPKPPAVQGTQWIIELYRCNPDFLNNEKKIESVMIAAAEAANATVVKHCFHSFSPQGVSGVVVISESHLTIHTWPEYGYCAVDIFTCSEDIEHNKAVKMLKEGLQSKEEKVFMVERGIRNRTFTTLPLVSPD